MKYPPDPQQRRLYNSYRSIRQTTDNPNDQVYRRQRAAGLDIQCEFANFREFADYVLTHLGMPGPGQRIVRIDQNQNWRPGNIELGSHITQGRRLRTSHPIEFGGELRSLAEWSRLLGIHHNTLADRLRRGWTTERAVTTPGIDLYRRNRNATHTR
jgi:hypothetical protein